LVSFCTAASSAAPVAEDVCVKQESAAVVYPMVTFHNTALPSRHGINALSFGRFLSDLCVPYLLFPQYLND
jgi:hypothetical protein